MELRCHEGGPAKDAEGLHKLGSLYVTLVLNTSNPSLFYDQCYHSRTKYLNSADKDLHHELEKVQKECVDQDH